MSEFTNLLGIAYRRNVKSSNCLLMTDDIIEKKIYSIATAVLNIYW